MSADPAAAQEMVRLSGQQGVPVIVVDGQVVVGFNQARLDQLLAAAPRRASLGVAVADAAKHLPGASGAYVGRVSPGSPGERAGLRVADVIVELAGRPVRQAADLEALLAGLRAGAGVNMTFQRGGQTLRAEVAL